MKVVVCTKRVGALDDEFEIDANGASVEEGYLSYALNEWDAAAIEEALLLCERLGEGEVVLVTVGGRDDDEVLRRGLAMGADRAIRIEYPGATFGDPLSIAAVLAGVIENEEADLVLCGAISSDVGSGAVGAALAGLLGFPSVAVVKAIEWSGVGSTATVHCELEGGVVAVTETTTPAVITIQTGINQPRYATFRAIKQAEEKEIRVVHAAAIQPSAVIRRLFVPERVRSFESLGTDAATVAGRIAEIISGAA